MSETRGPEYMPYSEWAVLDAARQKRMGRIRLITAVGTFVALVIVFAYPISKRIETISQLKKTLAECDQVQSTIALLNPDGTPFHTRLVEESRSGARRVELEDGKVIVAFDGKTKSRYEVSTNVFHTANDDVESFSRPPRVRLSQLLRNLDKVWPAAQCQFNADGSFEFSRRLQRILVRPGTGDTLAFVRLSTRYDDTYMPLAEWTISRVKPNIERFRIKPPSDVRVVNADPNLVEPIQAFPRNLKLLSLQTNRAGDVFLLESYREQCTYNAGDGAPYLGARRRFDIVNRQGINISSRMMYRKRFVPLTWPQNLRLAVTLGERESLGTIERTFKKPDCLMIPDYEFSTISDTPYSDFYFRSLLWEGAEADTGSVPSEVGKSTMPVVSGQVGIESFHRALAYSTVFDSLPYTDYDHVFYALYRCYRAIGASDNALKVAREGLHRNTGDPTFAQMFADAIQELDPS